jgi:hypothetical protein
MSLPPEEKAFVIAAISVRLESEKKELEKLKKK